MIVEDLRARFAIISVVILLSLVWNIPNFFNVGKDWFLSTDQLVYGLDIIGGLHLVMNVDTEGVILEGARRMGPPLKEDMAEQGITVENVELLDALKGEVKIQFSDSEQRKKGTNYIGNFNPYATQLQVISENEGEIVVRYLEVFLRDHKRRIVEQAIETIRNRIDEFGVAEPSITAQGTDRILIQLPGIEEKDASAAKDLINTTARLEFMMVADEMKDLDLQDIISKAEKKGQFRLTSGLESQRSSVENKDIEVAQGKESEKTDYENYTKLKPSDYVKKLNEMLAPQLPKGTMIIFEKLEQAKNLEAGRRPYLVRTDTELGGDDLKNAFVSFDDFGKPQVSLSFNARGAKKFGDLTGANVGKQMAVVLDKIIKVAPNINERIGGGQAVITLGGNNRDETMKEAQVVSMALRAGALPAALEQLEERTVGPTLGADSIRKASIAGIVGGVLVLVFMIFYYKVFGVIANIALALNILLVLAVLTSLRATLTLPGVAGIVLTVGMAVDANVIIFERIKEELRKGTGLALAVKEGFNRALSAILDANITTAAVCVVLMYYGTGPVRGFAVTLIIGIVTSMFTAIFVSRAIFDLMTQRLGYKKLAV